MRSHVLRIATVSVVAVAALVGVGGGSGHAADIACPVDGDSTYDDSFGWARSGGRRHQGIDMVADRGTPVVAARSGDALFKTSRLGGKSVWLTTDDGDRFFYAHLDAWEGESRQVEAGELIGYVGSTGNAGGPHLHFETHVGGSTVNPYAAVVAACSADSSQGRADAAPVSRPGPARLR